MNSKGRSYGTLLNETIPRVIKNKKEHKRLCGIVDELMDRESLSPDEKALLELISTLVDVYEREAFPPQTEITPLSMLEFMMDQHDLKQVDLIDVFGSSGRVSEVINGKREISKNQAKLLGERFNVSPGLFI